MEQVKKDLDTIFEQVKSAVGWSIDKRIILSIASYYVTTGKAFNGKRYLAVSDELKRKSSWTSPLRSHIHYMMVAFLDHEIQDPAIAIDEMLEKHEVLKQVGFKTTAYSYLSTLLMSSDLEQQTLEASRAKFLFDEMKKHHRFLTSPDDYPYAVVLGKMDGDVYERAETINKYFHELRPNGFYMGNELQWMSQILTYQSANYDDQMVLRAVMVRDQLKAADLKIKASHYVMVGFLAVLNLDEDTIHRVIESYRELESMKLFRWYKDMLLPIAVQLETKHILDLNETTSVSFATTIEMMMQAQQAAMIATMAATSAAVSASSSGS